MTFGRRTGPAARSLGAEPARPARGGYWVALFVQAGVSALTLVVMPFISQFRLNGSTLATLAVPAAIALLNVTVVAAVLMLLVDLALRALGWRNPWVYAASCALPALVFYVGLALAVGRINPIFALYVAVWPIAVGGWVLGRLRARNTVGR